MKTLKRVLWCSVAGLGLTACGEGDPPSSARIEFAADKDLLGAFEQDTGFLPAGSPVALRVRATASAGFTGQAAATTDGRTMEGVPESGTLSAGASFNLEVSAMVNVPPLTFEGVLEELAYTIEPNEVGFDPFLLDGEVELISELPAAELARIPMAQLPGSTLNIDVSGGQLVTRYSGVCAETRDGAGQYTGQAVTEGTVRLAGTFELSLGLTTENFGPFEVDVPVPATTTDIDFGTYDLATAEAASGASPCDQIADGTTGGMGSTSSNADASGPTGDASGPTGDASQTSSESADTSAGATGDTTSGEGDSSDGGGDCTPGNCNTCVDVDGCRTCVQGGGGECEVLLDACLADMACGGLVACLVDCMPDDMFCIGACYRGVDVASQDLYEALEACITGVCGE